MNLKFQFLHCENLQKEKVRISVYLTDPLTLPPKRRINTQSSVEIIRAAATGFESGFTGF